MRYFLLSAAFLLALLTGPVAAQVVPPPPRPEAAALAAPAAPTDTVAALHRLFAERRQRRNLIAGGTSILALIGVINAASEPNNNFISPAAGATIVGIFGGAVLGGELAFFSQYSRKKEQRAVDRFQAHRLDRDLRRKLKPRHFR